MPWLQIRLTVDRDQAPLLEAALESAGALAVTLDDAGDDPLLEPAPGTQPLWSGVRLTALFEDDPGSLALVQDLGARLGTYSLTPPQIERLEDRVWERVWLDEFRPTRFGRRLWVCPRGQGAPDPGAVVVDLDPGLAFGTGHHATTALCLEWLDGASLAGKTLLDYGCGSGILAIAALKLGAAHAVALDHDPQAIEATRANATANGVAGRLAACLPGDLSILGSRLPADLVIANILAGPLVELAPTLLSRLRPGGDLVLSGVLEEQVPTVCGAYTQSIDWGHVRSLGGWALIPGVRR
ncbi:MAG: 50S ribosomal protein L11 methyltransferase [Bdellovibrio bacteriovorus]